VAFQPGQSGNPGGRSTKEKPYRDMLRKVLAEELAFDPKEPKTKLEGVVRAHVAKAMTGDSPSLQHIADRLDGKVVQAIANDDESDAPFVIKVIRGGQNA
jgi:hypothetical protein